MLASLLRGFCAGMVYTSMEEFYQGHWVSRGTPRPANGSPFWDRLYQRQVDSLLEDVPRLTTWYFKSAEEMGRDVPAEWRDIQATIDRGELAPVLLIADGTLNIAESHVVLAYGYQWDEAWGNLVLNVYDPNRPGDDAAHVVIEFGGNHVRVALVEGTGSGRSFRGFYSKHYDRTPQAYPTDRGYGNTEDSRLLWMMDVDGDGEDDLVRYEPELQRFEIGKESPSKICFQDAGSTVQFGNLADGRPFLHGDFAGIHGLPDGLEDLIFYYPAQRAWWLGRSTGRGFEWISIGTTTGFGALWPGVRLWAADFDGDGAKDVLFHQPNDGNWWKGSMTSQGLAWTNVGNTTSFGQLLDGRPLFVGDFTGDQREDVLFYYEPHNKFWIGESDGAQLHWRGHDAPGRGPSASSPLAAGAFEGGGRHRILCRDPNGDRWILGRFDGGSVSWSVVGSDPASGEPDGARRFVLDLEGDGREELWIGTRNSGRHHVASIDPTGSLRWTDVPFYGILADEWVRRAEALFTGRGGSGRPGRQVRTSHVITPNNTQYLVSDLFTTLPMFLTRHLSCSAFGIDRFGSGCVGSNMQRVQLLGRGSSRLGESASLDTERALPGAPVWLAIGLSNTSWLGIPLPLDHTPFGAPGCYSYIDRILYVAGLASQTGGASFPTTWPNDPAIAGVVLYFQALCLDAGANALGMTSTNGVGIEIGALW
ncbi:MAG: VCBS repeat-containing protein [Planctomycetes bacterium]|nr:VCBS repeat-containing protein [Planctomycetota bacterium]